MPRLTFAPLAVLATLAASVRTAEAHPIDDPRVSSYLDFQYTGDARFRIAYLVDFAGAAADAEIGALDRDHDGQVTPTEQRLYLDERFPTLVRPLVIEVDDVPIPASIVASHLDLGANDAGSSTLRISAEIVAEGRAASGDEVNLHVHDGTFPGVPGWREIRAEDPGAAEAFAPSPVRTSDARFVFRARRGDPRPWWPRSFAGHGKLVAVVGWSLVLIVFVGVGAIRSRPKRGGG